MRQFRPPPLSELDPIMLGTRRVTLPRVAAFTLVSVLAGLGWSWPVGAAFFAAALLTEIGIWWASNPLARGRRASKPRRLAYAASGVGSVFAMLTLSVLFWDTPGAGSQFIALAIWAILLVNAISFAFRSPLAFLIFFAPVGLAMTLTPLLLPKFEGAQQIMAVCGTGLLTLYAGLSSWRDGMAARALSAANAELERARQTAETANAAKSEFLATMSHEIRTPLNGVLGMAQVMAQSSLPKAQRERLGIIQRSGEALLTLLNDLLDISRIEAGRLELEEGICDLEDIAGRACETFAGMAGEKRVALKLTVDPSAAGRWKGDPTRLGQIVHNLVSNAVKFTDNGRVDVRVAHRDERIVIEVADTGVGVPLKRQAALFDRFVQADASTTRRFGGSGLGLAICRELVDLMGGEIGIVSEPGQGSTFTVRLPLVSLEPAKKPAPGRAKKAAAAAPKRRAARLRILVAEDNPTNLVVLEGLLEELDAEVTAVEDGEAAFEACLEESFDLVLMDIQMPKMDGVTATKAIRELETLREARRTPIVALTANAMSHQVESYRDAGMDAVVVKPVQRDELMAAIETVVPKAKKAA